MGKYRVEFAIAENFESVDEWQTMDGLDVVEVFPAQAGVIHNMALQSNWARI